MGVTRSGPDRGIGSPSALRDANRRRLVDVLRLEGAASQAELARRTGLSRGTVFNIVRELEESGLVSLTESVAGGRRSLEVSFSRQAGLAVGLDLDHIHLRVAIADLNHRILDEVMVDVDEHASADTTIAVAAELIESLLHRLDANHADVIGVGLGLPAPIDPASGLVGSSAILPGWIGVPAAEAVQYRLGMPVAVDNDANLGALAEVTWGAARGGRDVVYLKLGSGVGAGLVLAGEVYRGAAGTAGEIGHTTVDEQGSVCRCGNRGCLETFVGAEALVSLLRATHGRDLTIARVIEMAQGGDKGAQRVITDAGRAIGVAVANLCNVLAPETVVIGGELAAAGDLLLTPLREVVRRHAIRAAADVAQIVPAALGDRAEAMGAIALVLREMSFDQPGVPTRRAL
jgi:predicted NBD/HSP70 family sugar kinase/biotin operon repressor